LGVTQTAVFTGSITYTGGATQQMPGTPTPDPLAARQVQPNGSRLNFFDAPGVISPRVNFGKVVSAQIVDTFVTNVTVTSGGGQKVRCPSIDWTATINWTVKGIVGGKARVTKVIPW
jgi:hypothetical protein